MFVEKSGMNISGIPQYVRIRELLRKSLQAGQFQIGDQIPSETELAQTYAVSRMTARRAVNELAEEGLLVRQSGLGTFVCDPKYGRIGSRLTSFHEEMQRQGYHPTSRVLSQTVDAATKDVAAKLQLNEGDKVIRIARLRYVDGKPVALQKAYIPYQLFPDLLDRTDLDTQSLYQIYEQRGFEIIKGKDRITAIKPNAEQIRLLGMSPAIPVILTERVTYAKGDKLIEFVKSYARADMYAYQVEILR